MGIPAGLFEKINADVKTVEMRLFDQKRQRMSLGDLVVFERRPDMDHSCRKEISGLLRYRTFADLVADVPERLLGYPDGYDKSRIIDNLRRIYSREDEKKYGVVGIRLEPAD